MNYQSGKVAVKWKLIPENYKAKNFPPVFDIYIFNYDSESQLRVIQNTFEDFKKYIDDYYASINLSCDSFLDFQIMEGEKENEPNDISLFQEEIVRLFSLAPLQPEEIFLSDVEEPKY